MHLYSDNGLLIQECETFEEFETIHTAYSLAGHDYEDVGEGIFLYYDGDFVIARVRAPLDTAAPA